MSPPVFGGGYRREKAPPAISQISDLKSAAPRLVLAPSSILPRMTGEEVMRS
jgi:hypothetical protein